MTTNTEQTQEALSVVDTLKLALEALEEIESYYGYDRSVGAMASSMYEASNLAKITSTRIRKALAEKPAPVAEPHKQQQPVGEAYLCDKCQTPFDGAYYCPECGHNTATKESVYTSPPANANAGKPWVGLTDDEMRDLEKQFNAERVRTSDEEYLVIYPGDYWSWQRALEAKLREKNA